MAAENARKNRCRSLGRRSHDRTGIARICPAALAMRCLRLLQSARPHDLGRVRRGRRPGGSRLARTRVLAGRPLWRVGNERARMGAPAVCHGANRRRAGEYQSRLSDGRIEIRAPPVRCPRAGPRRLLQNARTISTCSTKRVRSSRPPPPANYTARRSPNCNGLCRCAATPRPGMLPWNELLDRSDGVPPCAARRNSRQTRCERRHQHAVHVRHDRQSQRRDALAPQHPAQRVLCRRVPAARSHRPHLSARSAVPLFRLRAGNALLHGSRRSDGVPCRGLSARCNARRHREGAVHRRLRRAHHVHRPVGARRLSEARPVVAAHRASWPAARARSRR